MVDNAAIAELLIREAETAEGHREQAFRRAAHAAFMWPEEAMDIVAAGRSLAKQLHNWIASPPEVEVPAIRREFDSFQDHRGRWNILSARFIKF